MAMPFFDLFLRVCLFIMAAEIISLQAFEDQCKGGLGFDRYWVRVAVVRVVRNSTGNLTYPACASCGKATSSFVKKLDFSTSTSAFGSPHSCCNSCIPAQRWRFQVALMDSSNAAVPVNRIPLFTVWQAGDHLMGMLPAEASLKTSDDLHSLVRTHCFDIIWHLEIGLNRKNQERTVWSAHRMGDNSVFMDNPALDSLRAQFDNLHVQQPDVDSLPCRSAERKSLQDSVVELGRLTSVVDDLVSTAESLIRDAQQLRADCEDVRSSLDSVCINLSNIDSLLS
ncbi:hypothetical protein R1sor_017938 [Riccia sorocarpa]|uniref:Uncharacterized protein n=1 Tax=Riccia sorocarpa TaxID=122646 RepID=A0ABD3I9D6_9MARC